MTHHHRHWFNTAILRRVAVFTLSMFESVAPLTQGQETADEEEEVLESLIDSPKAQDDKKKALEALLQEPEKHADQAAEQVEPSTTLSDSELYMLGLSLDERTRRFEQKLDGTQDTADALVRKAIADMQAVPIPVSKSASPDRPLLYNGEAYTAPGAILADLISTAAADAAQFLLEDDEHPDYSAAFTPRQAASPLTRSLVSTAAGSGTVAPPAAAPLTYGGGAPSFSSSLVGGGGGASASAAVAAAEETYATTPATGAGSAQVDINFPARDEIALQPDEEDEDEKKKNSTDSDALLTADSMLVVNAIAPRMAMAAMADQSDTVIWNGSNLADGQGKEMIFRKTNASGGTPSTYTVIISGTFAPSAIYVDTSGFTQPGKAYSYDFKSNNGGIIADSANGPTSIHKTGSGVLVLDMANNTFSGGIFVEKGTLYVAEQGALGTGTVSLKDGTSMFINYTYTASSDNTSPFRNPYISNNLAIDGHATISFGEFAYNTGAKDTARVWRNITLEGKLAGNAGSVLELQGFTSRYNGGKNDAVLPRIHYKGAGDGAVSQQNWYSEFSLVKLRDAESAFEGTVTMTNKVNTATDSTNSLATRDTGSVRLALGDDILGLGTLDMTRDYDWISRTGAKLRVPSGTPVTPFNGMLLYGDQYEGYHPYLDDTWQVYNTYKTKAKKDTMAAGSASDTDLPNWELHQTYMNVLLVKNEADAGELKVGELKASFLGVTQESYIDIATWSEAHEAEYVRVVTKEDNTHMVLGKDYAEAGQASYFSGTFGWGGQIFGESNGVDLLTADMARTEGNSKESISLEKVGNNAQYIYDAKVVNLSVSGGTLGFHNLKVSGNVNLTSGTTLQLNAKNAAEHWVTDGTTTLALSTEVPQRLTIRTSDVDANGVPLSARVQGDVTLQAKDELDMVIDHFGQESGDRSLIIPVKTDVGADLKGMTDYLSAHSLLQVDGTLTLDNSGKLFVTGINFLRENYEDKQYFLAAADKIAITGTTGSGNAADFSTRVVTLRYGYYGILSTIDGHGQYIDGNYTEYGTGDADYLGQDYLVLRVAADPTRSWTGSGLSSHTAAANTWTAPTRADGSRLTYEEYLHGLGNERDAQWKENRTYTDGVSVKFGNLWMPTAWEDYLSKAETRRTNKAAAAVLLQNNSLDGRSDWIAYRGSLPEEDMDAKFTASAQGKSPWETYKANLQATAEQEAAANWNDTEQAASMLAAKESFTYTSYGTQWKAYQAEHGENGSLADFLAVQQVQQAWSDYQASVIAIRFTGERDIQGVDVKALWIDFRNTHEDAGFEDFLAQHNLQTSWETYLGEADRTNITEDGFFYTAAGLEWIASGNDLDTFLNGNSSWSSYRDTYLDKAEENFKETYIAEHGTASVETFRETAEGRQAWQAFLAQQEVDDIEGFLQTAAGQQAWQELCATKLGLTAEYESKLSASKQTTVEDFGELLTSSQVTKVGTGLFSAQEDAPTRTPEQRTANGVAMTIGGALQTGGGEAYITLGSDGSTYGAYGEDGVFHKTVIVDGKSGIAISNHFEQVVIGGTVRPGYMTVNSDYNLIQADGSMVNMKDDTNYVFSGDGCIADASAEIMDEIYKDKLDDGANSALDSWKTGLAKGGTGTLVIQTRNTYSGGSLLRGGLTIMQNEYALGMHDPDTDGTHGGDIEMAYGAGLMVDYIDRDKDTYYGADTNTSTLSNSLLITHMADWDNTGATGDAQLFNRVDAVTLVDKLSSYDDAILTLRGGSYRAENAPKDSKDLPLYTYADYIFEDPAGAYGTIRMAGYLWGEDGRLVAEDHKSYVHGGGNVQLTTVGHASAIAEADAHWRNTSIDLSLNGSANTVLALGTRYLNGEENTTGDASYFVLGSVFGDGADDDGNICSRIINDASAERIGNKGRTAYLAYLTLDPQSDAHFSGNIGYGVGQNAQGEALYSRGLISLTKTGGSLQEVHDAYLYDLTVGESGRAGGTFWATNAMTVHSMSTSIVGAEHIYVGDIPNLETSYTVIVGKDGILSLESDLNSDPFAGVKAYEDNKQYAPSLSRVLVRDGGTLTASGNWKTGIKISIGSGDTGVTINTHDYQIDPSVTADLKDSDYAVDQALGSALKTSHVIRITGSLVGDGVTLNLVNKQMSPGADADTLGTASDNGYIITTDLNQSGSKTEDTLTGLKGTINIGERTILQVASNAAANSKLTYTASGTNAALQFYDKGTSGVKSYITKATLRNGGSVLLGGVLADDDTATGGAVKSNNNTTGLKDDIAHLSQTDSQKTDIVVTHRTQGGTATMSNFEVDTKNQTVNGVAYDTVFGGTTSTKAALANAEMTVQTDKNLLQYTTLNNTKTIIQNDRGTTPANSTPEDIQKNTTLYMQDVTANSSSILLGYTDQEKAVEVVKKTVSTSEPPPVMDDRPVAASYTNANTDTATKLNVTLGNAVDIKYTAGNGTRLDVLNVKQLQDVNMLGTGLTLVLDKSWADYQKSYDLLALEVSGSGQFLYEQLGTLDGVQVVDKNGLAATTDTCQAIAVATSEYAAYLLGVKGAQVSNTYIYIVLPEPTTGTLSLLALAALCARRRRTGAGKE